MFLNRWPQAAASSALALAALLTSACNAHRGGPPSMGPPEVSVIAIQPEPLVLTTELPGRTSPYLMAEIRPQVNGIIQSRLFQEGALVHQGDVLYRIDPAPYEAAVGQAKANLATAEAELASAQANIPSIQAKAERYKDLVAIHAVGQQDYDDASAAMLQAQATVNSRKAAVEASKAALETARINLAYTPIKAPITGRIGRSAVTVGALASSYQATPLAVIQQLDPIYVDVVQANADLLRLRHSMESGSLKSDSNAQRKVKLVLEDGSTYSTEGKLEFRDVTVDSTTGAVTLRMVFGNKKETLLPGMFVRAVVEEGVREQAILVPQQAIQRDPKGLPFVWTIAADGKAERRGLELERAIGDRWLIAGGLNRSDQVVVEGADTLRAGSAVRTVPFKGSARGESSPSGGAPQAGGKAGGHV